MRVPDCIVIDFETYPIKNRPTYPPKPVGVAIAWPGERPFYMAFGHPTGNNCSAGDAMAELERCWASGLPILCHHAKFDLCVACEGGGLPELPWQRVHDTMYLAFLFDPHARKLDLKGLAAEVLHQPPDERDELDEWIMAHGAQLLEAYPWNKSAPGQRKITKRQCGAWIFATPGDIAGRYACGDITRTLDLFNELWPIIQENGMGAAYDRERQLMPILMENERVGMRVDLNGLDEQVAYYDQAMAYAETWLRETLGASGLNFDADADVANVLLQRGIVPEGNWTLTESNQLSMSKENLLPEHFTGPGGDMVAAALGYRNRLKTCLEMFMRPWLTQARDNGGYICTHWNQTRGGDGGTRTGRPSTMDPNFLNISKDFDGRDDGYRHPDFLELLPLPLVRKFVLPDEGEVWLHRDFNSQELRIFAHFEQGDLWQQYHNDPRIDVHAFVGKELMAVAQREIERTKVKVMNFQSLYGGGAPALQRKLRCSLAEAKELKAFHNKALPGRVVLNEEIKRIVKRGEPIRTWGGRLYFPEPVGKDGRDKIYKLINYEIQGSAADYTKQTIIEWHAAKVRSRFLVTVYDENNISALPEHADREMKILAEVMEAPRLTVPMLSDGKRGSTWGDLKKCA